jgi:hypothetical protein
VAEAKRFNLNRVNVVSHRGGALIPSSAKITVRDPATELKMSGEARVLDAAVQLE